MLGTWNLLFITQKWKFEAEFDKIYSEQNKIVQSTLLRKIWASSSTPI